MNFSLAIFISCEMFDSHSHRWSDESTASLKWAPPSIPRKTLPRHRQDQSSYAFHFIGLVCRERFVMRGTFVGVQEVEHRRARFDLPFVFHCLCSFPGNGKLSSVEGTTSGKGVV